MSIADAFRIRRVVPPTPLRPGEFRLEGGEIAAVAQEGVFVTPQSVASFPGAAAGVEVLAKVTHTLAPSWDQNLVKVVWSVVVGFVVFCISIAETWRTSGLQDKGTKCLIALINTAMLFLTAAGVDAVVTGASSNAAEHVTQP